METHFQFWKVYLDMCCLLRTFDLQTQVRIQHETTAIVEILFFTMDTGYGFPAEL